MARDVRRGRVTVPDLGLIRFDGHLSNAAAFSVGDGPQVRAHQHAAGAVKRGISSRSRPEASRPSRTTMGSGVHGTG